MHAYQECDWETRVLDKSAIEAGDYVKMSPFSGATKSFCINRTAIDFISDNFRGETGFVVKKIPSFRGDTIHLRMAQKEQKTSLGTYAFRYTLSTMNGRPFWHNGSLVFSIVLTDGDEIEIGHNKFKFYKKKLELNKGPIDFDAHEKILRSSMPILLEGRTGTGKSTIARKIHEYSGRSGDFVHINLSAFSESLMESELFGHVKGAFTGAFSDKKGAIARAHKGTLFLDEIDSTSMAVQVKLLLFLDNYLVTPVGGSTNREVDCRVIIASGSDLNDLIKSGKLRLDFFHRICSGQQFKLPTLNENPSVINDFCDNFEKRNNVIIEGRLRDFYQKVEWPGNFRQLAGHLERKKLMAKGYKIVFGEEDEALLKSAIVSDEKSCEVISLATLKDNYCIKIYFQCYKNMGITAQRLGISTKCLRAILKRHKIR